MEIQLNETQRIDTSSSSSVLEFSQQGIAKLSAALAKARKNFGAVKKTAENPFYKDSKGRTRMYADLPEMIEATANALADQGLSVLQFPTIKNSDRTVGVITLLTHESGEWIKSIIEGCPSDQKLKDGFKYDAQTNGIGFTYMRRYGYGAILNLGAEDDDGNGIVSQQIEKKPLVLVSSQSEPAKPTEGMPTPEQLTEFGKQLKALGQDNRLLRNYVERKAGATWKEIPLKTFESIVSELKQAEKDGNIKELISVKEG